MKNKSCQTGMTFIEIMIALLIGSILLGGVLQVFLGSKQTFRMQQALSRLQENGRFALDFLAKDIRMAGFLGCNSSILPMLNPPLPPTKNQPIPSTFTYVVSGYQDIPKNWNPKACGKKCIKGTDAITFYSGNSCGGLLLGKSNIEIDESNTCNINANSSYHNVVLISNCTMADIFIPTSVSLNKSKKIITIDVNNSSYSNNYIKNQPVPTPYAEIFSVNSYTYFIRTGKSGQPALWRLNNAKVNASNGNPVIASDNPIELIEGIENMQIVYGVDSDSDSNKIPNYYLPADPALDWTNVVSVQISLLAVSLDDNLTTQPVPYTFNNILTTPKDHRIRRVFNTTIALRNRLL